MKEIVWVFGTSASGKETFINYVVSFPDSELAKSLGWEKSKITKSLESIKYRREYYADPVSNKRSRIIKTVPELLKEHDVILIKWQEEDSLTNRPTKLKQLLTNYRHRIILLVAEPDVLSDRLKNKEWWDQQNATKFIDEEIAKIAKYIEELGKDYCPATINSTSPESYRFITTK